ncbi:MAG: hypothetical protein WCL39_15700, partial [Armatimonadota bacterium]
MPGVGPVAEYWQGTFLIGQPPTTSNPDPTMGGWQHLAVGWNLWAFAKWYEVTGDRKALGFATALGNRYINSTDADGNDGSLRPDGSFGGKKQESSASWHMHGHTHGLPGLTLLGEQLIRAGDRKSGLKFLNQAHKTFDWLYDPTQNPDAGSVTGWLGEWLMVATGWDRSTDCEGCTMGDVVQTACTLGAASRLDPTLATYSDYYDRAEQIYRGQLVGQMFRLTPQYLTVMKGCIEKRVAKEVDTIGPRTTIDTLNYAGTGSVSASLGKRHLSPGIYTVNVEPDGTHPFMLDYAELNGPRGTTRMESETWMGCAQSDISEGSRARVTPGSWHGTRYSICGSELTSGIPDGTKISARVPIEVPKDGNYALKASVIKSDDVGIIEFAIDGGQTVSLDCYQPARSTVWSLEDVGQFKLTAGTHLVTLTWTGGRKNTNSSSAIVLCDYITIGESGKKYDLENTCQDGVYNAKDKKVYGWTINCDPACQKGFSGAGLSYFVNEGAGYAARIPFIVDKAGDYEIVVAGIKSSCGANGIASAFITAAQTPSSIADRIDKQYRA